MTAREFLAALPTVGAIEEWYTFDKKTGRHLDDAEWNERFRQDMENPGQPCTWDGDITISWTVHPGESPERATTDGLMALWSVKINRDRVIEQLVASDCFPDQNLIDGRIPF